MILRLYLIKEVFLYIGIVLFLFSGISFISDFTQQLKQVNDNFTILDVLTYSLLKLPGKISLLFFSAILLGVILGLGSLASNNELNVLLVSGISSSKITWIIIQPIAVVAIVFSIFQSYIIVKTERTASNFIYTTKGKTNPNAIKNNDIWFEDSGNYIRIKHVDLKGYAQKIEIIEFNKNRTKINSITKIDNAKYNSKLDLWLSNQNTYSSKTRFIYSNNSKENFKISTIKSNEIKDFKLQLKPEYIIYLSLKPEYLNNTELYKYVAYLRKIGQKNTNYEQQLYNRIFYPLILITAIFLGINFIFGPLRNVSIGTRIISGIIVSASFEYIYQIIDKVTLVYKIPAFIPSLLIITALILLSLYLKNSHKIINFIDKCKSN